MKITRNNPFRLYLIEKNIGWRRLMKRYLSRSGLVTETRHKQVETSCYCRSWFICFSTLPDTDELVIDVEIFKLLGPRYFFRIMWFSQSKSFFSCFVFLPNLEDKQVSWDLVHLREDKIFSVIVCFTLLVLLCSALPCSALHCSALFCMIW